MNIAYVILHYMSGKDTIECVESLLNVTNKSIHNNLVIVVDNGSPNASFEKVVGKYQNSLKVNLIKSQDNLGFAKGNNIGFVYAKYVFGADFIVLLNNDTIINQMNFSEVLVDKYEKSAFGILGPDIVTIDGFHQNPVKETNWTRRKLFAFRLKKKVQYFFSHFPFMDKYLQLNEGAYSKSRVEEEKEGVQLHGACLIFSPLYISKCNGLFDKTFLYMEEDILKFRAEYFGCSMMYTPDLVIQHKEDIATNMAAKTSIEKKKGVYCNLLKSSKIYASLRKQYGNNSLVRKIIICAAKKIKGNDYNIDSNIPTTYLLRMAAKRATMLLRGRIVLGAERKKRMFCGRHVAIKCKKLITFGDKMTISDNVYIDALSCDGIYFGRGSSIGKYTQIRCSGNLNEIGTGFHMGNNSSLADSCFVGATGGVWIGDDVIGGQNVRFHASNHVTEDLEQLIRTQGVRAKGIYVGNNCWIGAGAVFCDGSSIGDGCVVAANAVVTKKFPSNCVLAGVPAKVIRKR